MESLRDPLHDRVIPTLPLPPCLRMPIDQMIPAFSKYPSWRLLREHFASEGSLTKSSAIYLISQAKFLFNAEKNLLELSDPITIVGDIHGQYYDLLKILELSGDPTNTQYLFLGDYVDRGIFSVEVILLLYAIKINYPKKIHMLRGNHESRHLTSFFNFREEVLHKYDLEIYEMIMDSFDSLPLAAVINKRFLGIHGGLSPDLVSLKDIDNLNRFSEPPRQGLFCDILWSDPVDTASGLVPGNYKFNTTRTCSYVFGYQATKQFVKKNKLTSIIRAHEAQLEGYKMYKWDNLGAFPMIVTVFSAPNYCDTYNNKGAIIQLGDNMINIKQFSFTPHPYHLPKFMDVFSWSIPYVIEKTLDMVTSIVKHSIDLIDEEEFNSIPPDEVTLSRRNSKFINDILKISLIMQLSSSTETEPSVISKAVDLSPDSIDPPILPELCLETKYEQFIKAKTQDGDNEKRPD